jgi:hypothetical protein
MDIPMMKNGLRFSKIVTISYEEMLSKKIQFFRSWMIKKFIARLKIMTNSGDEEVLKALKFAESGHHCLDSGEFFKYDNKATTV